MYDIGLTKDQLINISKHIGADVPFFIKGGMQYGKGVGNKLTSLKIKLPYTVLLVFPNCTINTRWAYSQVRNKLEIPTKAVNFADLIGKDRIPFQLVEHLGLGLGKVTIRTFSDGELWVKFEENIRGNDVFIIQSTCGPAENLIELFLLLDAAVRASARRVTAVIPYFGYGRQDRKDQPRVPISSRVFLQDMF